MCCDFHLLRNVVLLSVVTEVIGRKPKDMINIIIIMSSIYVSMYVSMYLCIYLCMYVCIYVSISHLPFFTVVVLELTVCVIV